MTSPDAEHSFCVSLSGGVDKIANVWDTRQPFSPMDRQLKGE